MYSVPSPTPFPSLRPNKIASCGKTGIYLQGQAEQRNCNCESAPGPCTPSPRNSPSLTPPGRRTYRRRPLGLLQVDGLRKAEVPGLSEHLFFRWPRVLVSFSCSWSDHVLAGLRRSTPVCLLQSRLYLSSRSWGDMHGVLSTSERVPAHRVAGT